MSHDDVSGALDLTELRRVWEVRREAMRAILRRFDPRGMTRPARDPSERGWLEARGEGWFMDDDRYADAAREYYARKYRR